MEKDMIDDLLEQFDLGERKEGAPERTVLSLFVLVSDKEMFDDLQDRTRKNFGDELKNIIVPLIRRAHAKSFPLK